MSDLIFKKSHLEKSDRFYLFSCSICGWDLFIGGDYCACMNERIEKNRKAAEEREKNAKYNIKAGDYIYQIVRREVHEVKNNLIVFKDGNVTSDAVFGSDESKAFQAKLKELYENG